MRITKEQLRQMVLEELERTMEEDALGPAEDEEGILVTGAAVVRTESVRRRIRQRLGF